MNDNNYKIIKNNEHSIEIEWNGFRGVSTNRKMFTVKDIDDGEYLLVYDLPINTPQDCYEYLIGFLTVLRKI